MRVFTTTTAVAVALSAASVGHATTLTTLATFSPADNYANGYNPEAGVIVDSAGNFYGTTSVGGSGGGAVFKLSATGFVVPGIAAVPEPAMWAMLIAGFGAVGGATRRRRAVAA